MTERPTAGSRAGWLGRLRAVSPSVRNETARTDAESVTERSEELGKAEESCARAGAVEILLVFAGCLAATLAALAWSGQRRAMLWFGDAEAHLHIARRLFDSHRPGVAQLGSVWLPLPHLLLAPLVALDGWWRSGFAGAIPSGIEFVLADVGLYWLARRWLSVSASVVTLLLIAANANLLYLSTTAMTEPLFVAELIGSVVLLVEWRAAVAAQSDRRAGWLLWLLTGVLVAAVATRYDGWILGFAVWCSMAVLLGRRGLLIRAQFISASVVLLMAPLAWMAYNKLVFRDALDFMRGPYSARAIELRTAQGVFPPHPGWHDPWVALLFFGKAAEMVAAVGWMGQLLMVVSLGGAVLMWRTRRLHTARWTLLLWLPLPFYCYSVAYGSVPIFLPVWWPHSWYNMRYGLELLPALALFAGFAAEALLRMVRRWRPMIAGVVAWLLIAGAGANAVWVMRHDPVVIAEARSNHEARWAYEYQIATRLGFLHRRAPKAMVLMDTSSYPQIIPDAGLTYRQTLNESDKRFYTEALRAPAQHADIALAFADDRVESAIKVHASDYQALWTFEGLGQPKATIYVSDTLMKKLQIPGFDARVAGDRIAP